MWGVCNNSKLPVEVVQVEWYNTNNPCGSDLSGLISPVAHFCKLLVAQPLINMGDHIVGEESKLQNLEQVVQFNKQFCLDMFNWLQTQMGALQSQMKVVNHNHLTIVEKLNGGTWTSTLALLASPPQIDPHGMYASVRRQPQPVNHMGFFNTPKLDFPFFERENLRQWIRQTNRYFTFNSIDGGQKVMFASLHLYGRAEACCQAHSDAFATATWGGFLETMGLCFSEAFENVIMEFKKLLQISSMEEYQARFEELQPLVLQKNRGRSESYFVTTLRVESRVS